MAAYLVRSHALRNVRPSLILWISTKVCGTGCGTLLVLKIRNGLV